MTILKELFYTDAMVVKRYAQLSPLDKERFDQMKVLAEQIKMETGDYSLIEDLMAKVVLQRFGHMQKQDVKSMLGQEGEGAKGGKVIEKVEEGYLRIKKDPGAELDKVVVSAVVLCKDLAVLQYVIVEDEDGLDCISLGSDDSDVEQINKIEVRDVLKNLDDLKRQEADCIDKLAKAVPEMEDRDIVIVSEKMQGMDLPKCVYKMYQRIGSPRNFRVALAAGERLLSLYRKNQVGADVETVPNLC